MQKKAEQVWQDFMQALGENDDRWQALVADDVQLVGPVMKIHGKDAYIKATQDFFQMVSEFKLHRHIADDHLVATEESFTISTPTGDKLVLDVSEIYDIQDGKIRSVKIYYDAEPFRQAFAMDMSPEAATV